MLDFQDARKGPITYDLASLIYDSYVSITEDLKKKITDEFWLKRGRIFFQSKEKFLNSLYETALQRNIKAIGTFAFQRIEKENPRYLSYIPNTVKSVRSHFCNLKKYKSISANDISKAMIYQLIKAGDGLHVLEYDQLIKSSKNFNTLS